MKGKNYIPYRTAKFNRMPYYHHQDTYSFCYINPFNSFTFYLTHLAVPFLYQGNYTKVPFFT